jgi:carboxylesterase type B
MPRNPSFRAAILQSGQTSLYINRNNSDTTPWTTLMSALNCTGSDSEILQCARVADATSIKSIGEHAALAFRPVSDNITQLEFPAEARAAGHIARVPILTGTNAQEGRLFTINQTNVTTFLETTFPSLPAAFYSTVVAAYPEGTPGLENGYDVNAQIFTDFFFQCPAAIVANSSCTLAKLPTWRYLFNATFPNTQLLPGIGVYHSSEIPIVFGTYPQGNANQEEVKLSQYMQTAWANFAKDPSGGPGWANWPEVGVLEAAGGEAVETSVEAGALDQRCALYAAIYAEIGI